jgi:hypothetical protein
MLAQRLGDSLCERDVPFLLPLGRGEHKPAVDDLHLMATWSQPPSKSTVGETEEAFQLKTWKSVASKAAPSDMRTAPVNQDPMALSP